MSTVTETKPKFASMYEVVMKKSELLTKLGENKAKHDTVLATAIAGYWELAQQKIDLKRKKMNQSVEEWKTEAEAAFAKVEKQIATKETLPNSLVLRRIDVDTGLGLVFPEDHSRDYERALAMMESSIYEEVVLTANEYDAYVLNNWEWKNNFIANNALYVDTYRGKYNSMISGVAFAASGAAGPAGAQGAVGQAYNRTTDAVTKSYATEGVTPKNF